MPRDYFLAHGLAQLRVNQSPDVRVQVQVGETQSLIKRLEAGELQAVIATQRITRRALHYLPVMTEQFVLAAPYGLTPVRRWTRPQLAAWLETQAWIAYAPDLPIIRRFWQEVFGRRPDLQARLVLPDLHLIVRAVTLGYGLSVLPDYLVHEAVAEERVEIPWRPPKPPGNQLYLVCLRERADTPEVRWLRDRYTSGL